MPVMNCINLSGEMSDSVPGIMSGVISFVSGMTSVPEIESVSSYYFLIRFQLILNSCILFIFIFLYSTPLETQARERETVMPCTNYAAMFFHRHHRVVAQPLSQR